MSTYQSSTDELFSQLDMIYRSLAGRLTLFLFISREFSTSVARFRDFSQIWGFFIVFWDKNLALGKFPKRQKLGIFSIFPEMVKY